MRSGIEGKVIAITGASSGVGAAAARLLAAQGAHVVLGARRVERLAALAAAIEDAGGQARHERLDVRDRRDTQRFISLAHAWYGRLDVIVNAAAVMPPAARLDALQSDAWDRTIDVNLRGVLHSIAAGLPLLQAQRQGGQFVNLVGSMRGSAVHDATEQALRTLTQGLRREAGPRVRVSLVSTAQALPVRVAIARLCGLRGESTSVDAVARTIVTAVQRPMNTEICAGMGQAVVAPFTLETIGAQRFPSSPSGSLSFFGENDARPRSSGANLN